MDKIKNVVFDLCGVVFSRDPRKFEREFIEFFSYITLPQMPHFWEEYDRGVSTYDKVLDDLAEYNHCDRELAEKNLRRSIVNQEEITVKMFKREAKKKKKERKKENLPKDDGLSYFRNSKSEVLLSSCTLDKSRK